MANQKKSDDGPKMTMYAKKKLRFVYAVLRRVSVQTMTHSVSRFNYALFFLFRSDVFIRIAASTVFEPAQCAETHNSSSIPIWNCEQCVNGNITEQRSLPDMLIVRISMRRHIYLYTIRSVGWCVLND